MFVHPWNILPKNIIFDTQSEKYTFELGIIITLVIKSGTTMRNNMHILLM